MNINEILIAVGILCIIALVIGIVLGIAEKVFHVEIDEKEVAVRAVLPSSNCGACGYTGCDGLAKAIANNEASINSCPVGGNAVAEKIAVIMGQDYEDLEKMVAYVKCDANCEKKNDYNYFGINTCEYLSKMPGSSPYACKFGCLGLGSCAHVCPENAIKIVDNKAVVDESLCIACGKCVDVCPHNLIELVPASSNYRVQCSSMTKGKEVINSCDAGCIGCGICYKNCPHDAIIFEKSIARIDYNKCQKCGICAEKCPRKIIRVY